MPKTGTYFFVESYQANTATFIKGLAANCISPIACRYQDWGRVMSRYVKPISC